METKEYARHWLDNKVWKRLQRPLHQNRLRWCAEQCEGETFVDVGCACGHSTEIMKEFKKGKWYGVDFDFELINNADDLFDGISFYPLMKVTDLHMLGKFDSVVCSEVIEHVPDDKGLVSELWEITGKMLIVTTPSRFVDDPGHLRLYNEKQLQKLFNIEGAETTIEKAGRFWRITVRRR